MTNEHGLEPTAQIETAANMAHMLFRQAEDAGRAGNYRLKARLERLAQKWRDIEQGRTS